MSRMIRFAVGAPVGVPVHYAASVSDVEPRRHPKKDVVPRHIPQVVVAVPPDEARDFVRDALTGTSFLNPYVRFATTWALFEPRIRFTAVDATHTRIELDVTELVRGAGTLFYMQRRGEIDRFFVAIEEELERRERWRPRPPSGSTPIEP